jgi:hypothetical protein
MLIRISINLDGGDLAIGLQNGTVCVFDVLGNGDFHLRTDGISQVDQSQILFFELYVIYSE